MTSRINYNAPLKSVRTVRALKIEQCDPQTLFADDRETSDGHLVNESGIAFVWENAPGRSKVEQEKPATSPGITRELKPPPQQALAPPPALKSPPSADIPPPAGTSPVPGSNSRSAHHIIANNLPSPEAAAAAPATDAPPGQDSRPKPFPVTHHHHQLPPRHSQVRSKTPPPGTGHGPQSRDLSPKAGRARPIASSVPNSGYLTTSRPLLSPGDIDGQLAAKAAGSSGRDRDPPVAKGHAHHRHNPSLPVTLPSASSGSSGVLRSDRNRGGGGRGLRVSISVDPVRGEGSGGSTAFSTLERGSQDYLAERLLHAPVNLVKDFYLSGRHTANPIGSTLNPGSAYTTLPNSRLPTRPNSASASETGSHSDDDDLDGEDDEDDDDDGRRTDAGDASSRAIMNAKDFDARCQVSVVDGDPFEASRNTDPHVRDFIMERFLPAAKAMVTDLTTESSDRRSSQTSPSLSPTGGGGKGRHSLPGRSRFAFKDRFGEDGEGGGHVIPDHHQSDMLFKSNKFPWQMGALKPPAVGVPQQQRSPGDLGSSMDQSPSPTALITQHDESSPRPSNDDQHDTACTNAEFDGSGAPGNGNVCSFEERRFPANSRSQNTSATDPRQTSRMKDANSPDSSRALALNSESARGAEGAMQDVRKVNDLDSKPFVSGASKGQLDEEATNGSGHYENGTHGSIPVARSPDVALASGTLGTLLKTTQHQQQQLQQRRDLGRNSGVNTSAAGANVKLEIIPPASILNHSRNNALHAAAAAAASRSSPNGGTNSEAKQSFSITNTSVGTGPGRDENGSNAYPTHLKVNIIRHQEQGAVSSSGNSGRSTEILSGHDSNSTARSKPHGPERPGHQLPLAKVQTTTAAAATADAVAVVAVAAAAATAFSSPADSPSNDLNAPGWPLGKSYAAYAMTPSSDSRDASFSSASDQSFRSPFSQSGPDPGPGQGQGHGPGPAQGPGPPMIQQQQQQQVKSSSSDKYSPVSVLQPPLPKSPAESWLCKVRPQVPQAPKGGGGGGQWQGSKPKKTLEYSLTDDSMDVKWEVLVKSENAQRRNKLSQVNPSGPLSPPP